jgi:transcriptional accessory protein Tex/SPT6
MRPAVSSRTRAPITGSSRSGKSTADLAAIERTSRDPQTTHFIRNPENRFLQRRSSQGFPQPTRLKISMADDMSFNPTRDDFEALLNDSMGGRDFAEGTVVKGKVVGIEKDFAIIDVGLKTEGRIQLKEFGVDEAGKATIKIGDSVEVFLERLENALGEAVISREKAKREEAWTRLEGQVRRQERTRRRRHRRPA